MKWLTDIFKSKKQSKRKVEYFQITSDWNADSVSPKIQLEINGDRLTMEILVNHLVFDDFEEGDKAKITFQNCTIYSLNHCNDEGYYYGQYRISPNELPWGEFYEIKSGLDRILPEPVTIINKEQEGKRHYIFFFKDETFECLADDFKLELQDEKGNRKRLNYSYKLRQGYHSDKLLIEFVKIGDANRFIERLLDLLANNGFSFDEITDVWQNDQVWIQLRSSNGKTTITKDIWDKIFILGEENKIDIKSINQILIESGEFEKIEINPEDYKKKEKQK